MALVTTYDTPASLRDMPAGSPFYASWHAFIAGRLAPFSPGLPRGEFYDASQTDVTIAATHHITWMAMPRTVLVFSNRDARNAAFAAGENRNVQDEYCEWHVRRNAAGRITRITFTTEVPEYWEALWAVNRAAVVNLYRSLVDPAITEANLSSSPGVYRRDNPFNTTHGIVHMIQSINNLGAALGLAQGAVNSPFADSLEQPPNAATSVDPRVVIDVGALARRGLSVTLREPIGLYMTHWDDTGFTRPDGRPVGNYWRVVRGVPGLALRLVYEVPATLGFVVGDIRVGGRPIEHGGQVAEHVTVLAAGVAGLRT